MTNGAQIHVGDIGTIFRVTFVDKAGTAIDVSSATTQEIIFRKPSCTVVRYQSSFDSDGSDGKVKYTTESGDLDEAGVWSIQSRVVLPSGEWRTEIEEFEVEGNL